MKRNEFYISILLFCLFGSMIHAETAGRENEFAIVSVSVANMREQPGYAAEMATQCLLGTPLLVLERKSQWLAVETPEGYRCWVNRGCVTLADRNALDEWNASPRIVFLDQYGSCFSGPDAKSSKVADLVAGCIIRYEKGNDGFHRIIFPDGRTAYVRADSCRDFRQWSEHAVPSGETLIACARELMGVPYLWGGTSPKMLDCSGLVKHCFFMNGVIVPRNASQQAGAAEPVDIENGFEELRKGDLLFFGTKNNGGIRITHVGIYIENGDYIHEAGRVRLASLDSRSSRFDKSLADRLVKAGRLHAPGERNGVVFIKEHPLYRVSRESIMRKR